MCLDGLSPTPIVELLLQMLLQNEMMSLVQIKKFWPFLSLFLIPNGLPHIFGGNIGCAITARSTNPFRAPMDMSTQALYCMFQLRKRYVAHTHTETLAIRASGTPNSEPRHTHH